MTFLASTVLAPPFGLARFVGPPYCWSKTVKWVMSQVRIARHKTYSVFRFLLPNATSCLGIANRVPSAFLQFESACNLTSKDFWKVSVHWTFPWFYFSFLWWLVMLSIFSLCLLAFSMSSVGGCLFRSFAHFLIGLCFVVVVVIWCWVL